MTFLIVISEFSVEIAEFFQKSQQKESLSW